MATRWSTPSANRYLHELFIGKQVRVVTTAALPDQSSEGSLDEITDDAFSLTDSKDRTVFIMRAQVVAIMLASDGSMPVGKSTTAKRSRQYGRWRSRRRRVRDT